MNLFYAPDLNPDDKLFVFDKNESRHISRVLRKNIGEIVWITNGKGGLFKTKIIDNNPNKTKVEIIDYQYYEKKSPKIHIAIAPTKSNDRMEWFMEKATEIGIDEITPLLTEHSERKKINMERYNRVLVAAMKQSLQYHLPRLNPLTSWKDFIIGVKEQQRLIAYCQSKEKISNLIRPKKDTILLIGPEGGFSESEFEQAVQRDFQPVLLSENRLRTETAGIVGLTTIKLNL